MSNIIENILQFHAYKYNLSLLIVFLVFFKLNLFKLELFSFFIISDQGFVPIQSNQFQTIRKLHAISI